MSETFAYSNLVAGDYPIVTEEVTVLSGSNLVKGTAIGIVTSSGKAKINDSAQSDGTETFYAILLEDVDASAADKVGVCALTGEFNREKLIFGGTDTYATHKAAARALSTFFRAVLDTDGVSG